MNRHIFGEDLRLFPITLRMILTIQLSLLVVDYNTAQWIDDFQTVSQG